jgi:hypothetical protein
MRRSGIRAGALGASAAVIAVQCLTPPPPVAAFGGCGLFPNRYAQQATTLDGYKGVYGRYEIGSPYVANYNSAFSLSHIYPYYKPSGGSSFVEVGWYKGYGPGAIAYPGPRDYTAKADSVTPYTEYDYSSAGSSGAMKDYKVEYLGYNSSSGTFTWGAFAGNLATPVQYWAHKDMATAAAIAGAEVSSNASSGSTGFSHQNSLKLQTSFGSGYSLWNSSLMSSRSDATGACNDASLVFNFVSNYTEHTVSGTV